MNFGGFAALGAAFINRPTAGFSGSSRCLFVFPADASVLCILDNHTRIGELVANLVGTLEVAAAPGGETFLDQSFYLLRWERGGLRSKAEFTEFVRVVVLE